MGKRARSPVQSIAYPILASGLPRSLQWPGAMSSLTVARQRGNFTRFPVLPA
jgi:hypothetical protein